MKIAVDAAARSVSLSVPRSVYSEDAVRIAALVLSSRAEAYHEATRAAHELTLVARRKTASAAELEALGGDFLNELLNQEYRFVVARFNRKIADRIVAQTLYAARGGDNPPPARHPAEDTAEFKAEAARLMAAAAEEIKRVMPKRLPPQGRPMTLPEDDGR